MERDLDIAATENDIVYPPEAEDERSVQRRWQQKKTAYCIIPKQKSVSR